jgi:two-component sensor histidine kinase
VDDKLAHPATVAGGTDGARAGCRRAHRWEIGGEAAQPTLLVLTELLTNAIEHANAPIRITLAFSPDVVRVQVHDAAPQPPQHPPHDPTRIRGHGLQIVAALALRRGWTPEPDGKTVWAAVPTDWPAPPPPG